MKNKMLKNSLKIIAILIILLIATRSLKIPHQSFYKSEDSFVFSKGNAPENVRAEISQQLTAFQKGYEERDTSAVEPFMEKLFSSENALVLGTMPQEIFVGNDEVHNLVFNDWDSWGDCHFLVDTVHISTHGDVAWIATIGYVEFDLSSLLVLPLRLTGILVKEDSGWRFQQTQFQFDLDLSFWLLTIIVLIVALMINSAVLIFHITRWAMKLRKSQLRGNG